MSICVKIHLYFRVIRTVLTDNLPIDFVFREGVKSAAVDVSQIGVKLNLSIGTGSKTLTHDLYEAKAIERKTQLQNVLFRLAERATDLENKLEKASKDIEKAKTSGTSVAGKGIDLGVNKGSKTQSKAVQKVGMSALNPGSKKRKTAKGVQFN